ncbi:hypothetical protein [Streptomyces albus]|uniref:hypothetical protein n=1 Tax=Streptomyces albus TaxID=1888 RepID=UPI0033F45499
MAVLVARPRQDDPGSGGRVVEGDGAWTLRPQAVLRRGEQLLRAGRADPYAGQPLPLGPLLRLSREEDDQRRGGGRCDAGVLDGPPDGFRNRTEFLSVSDTGNDDITSLFRHQ